MRPFRFRAQPALDARRREDDDAARACGEAEALLRAAQEEEQRARSELVAAQQLRLAPDAAPHEQEWHRFWIIKLEQAALAASTVIGTRRAALEAARRRRIETRTRVDALERFLEKAREAYDRAVYAEEQRLMDAAGTARFVTQRRALARTADDQVTKECA